jgi:hypothetical protein
MRVARGFFRLWIVLSVLWIGAVGTVAVSSLPPPDPPSIQGAAFSASEFAVFGARKAATQIAIEIALIPPVLVLVFGSALGWAIRGFRT